MTKIYGTDDLQKFKDEARAVVLAIPNRPNSTERIVRASWRLSQFDHGEVGPVSLALTKDGFIIRNEEDQKTFVWSAIQANQITQRPNGVRFTNKMLPWFVDVEEF